MDKDKCFLPIFMAGVAAMSILALAVVLGISLLGEILL